MGAFFESALLFSLAVLIILVGLLIYYFKGRISDVEQKNLKCFEIINDVYKSHLELKFMIQNAQVETPNLHVETHKSKDDQRIKIEIQECSEDSCSDSDDSDDSCSDSDDSDSDSDNNFNDDQIKMVNIDFSNEIEIEDIDDIEVEVEDLDVDIEEEVEDMDDDIEEDIEVEEVESAKIIVSKLEIEGDIDLSVVPSTNNDRESYKKMNISALRGFIISNGYQTDSAKLQKMKKNELIDLIIEH